MFTPYKRRRRAKEYSDGDSKKPKTENSQDDSHEESSNEVVVPDKEVWPQFVSDDLVIQQPQEQEATQTVHQVENGYSEDTFKKLEDLSSKMLKLSYEFKRTLEEAREVYRQQRREQTIVAQLGSRGEVIEAVGLQPSTDTHNKKVYIFLFFKFFT